MIYKTYIAVDERVAAWPGFKDALLEIQEIFNRVHIMVEMQMDEIEVIPADQFIDPNDTEQEAGDIETVYGRWQQWSPLRKQVRSLPEGGIGSPPNTYILYLPYFLPVIQDDHPDSYTAGRTYEFGGHYVEMVHNIYCLLMRRNEILRRIENNYNPNYRDVLKFLVLLLHELGHSFDAEHDGWWDFETNEVAGTEEITIMFGSNMVIADKSEVKFSKKSLTEMKEYMEFEAEGGSMYYKPEENWMPKIVSMNVDAGKFSVVQDFVIGRFGKNDDTRTYEWYDSIQQKTINIREKTELCLSNIGGVLPDDVQELFWQDKADVLKYFAPKLGWPMKLDNSCSISQGFCEEEYGLLDTFDKVVRGTYNAGLNEDLKSHQGYRHTGNDIEADFFHFFTKGKNEIINPFPDGMPVIAKRNKDGYPDRDGAADEHGKSGNTYELYGYLDGDVTNFAPWNRLTLEFVHCFMNSWMFDVDEILITKFGIAIGRIGCSGYAGVKSEHGHVVFKLSTQAFNPYYGSNSFFLKAPIFRNQEQLMQLIDYPKVNRTKDYIRPDGSRETVVVYPKEYKDSEGYSTMLRCSVDDGDMAFAHTITPGLHKYTFESTSEIAEIWFERNPWGEWKLIQEPYLPSNWWKWLKEQFRSIVLDKPTSRNLMDYSIVEPEFGELIRVIAYKDPITCLLYETPPEGIVTTPLSIHLYTCTIIIPSKGPDDPTKWGYHTFYARNERGVRSNRFVLKLVKEKEIE